MFRQSAEKCGASPMPVRSALLQTGIRIQCREQKNKELKERIRTEADLWNFFLRLKKDNERKSHLKRPKQKLDILYYEGVDVLAREAMERRLHCYACRQEKNNHCGQ